MKRLNSIENDQVQLEVVECDCGFHLGIDATYLDQLGDCITHCPNCDVIIDTGKVFPEYERVNQTLVIDKVNFDLLEQQRKALIELEVTLPDSEGLQALQGVISLLDEWSDSIYHNKVTTD